MEFLSENKKKKLKDFVKFVKKELKIKKLPKIIIQSDRKGLTTTAVYDYSNKKQIVKVYGKNRALVDIMRSVGHELVHHKQFEDKKLTQTIKDGEDGSDIENEANAKAGVLIRKYGKIDKNIYEE